MIYLDLEDLLHVATRTLGAAPEIRDVGLLASALARPQATAFGEAAYPTIHQKAAALLHTLARSNALVDGNKRLAFGAMTAFYGMNGMRLTLTNDRAYDLIVEVASGTLSDVPAIGSRLEAGTEPR